MNNLQIMQKYLQNLEIPSTIGYDGKLYIFGMKGQRDRVIQKCLTFPDLRLVIDHNPRYTQSIIGFDGERCYIEEVGESCYIEEI